jgi:hypothetical protein
MKLRKDLKMYVVRKYKDEDGMSYEKALEVLKDREERFPGEKFQIFKVVSVNGKRGKEYA